MHVLINQTLANIYYVSPGQVNILVPPSISPGPATIQLVNDTLAGPPVRVTLLAAAPGLFQLDQSTVIAQHANGTLVNAGAPAQRGEIVILYCTGLGVTDPAAVANQPPTRDAPIARLSDFRVWLNGAAVDPAAIKESIETKATMTIHLTTSVM